MILVPGLTGTMTNSDNNALGDYLKDRRAKLDPAVFGFSTTRRRTPGLRREEVAQRANVSTTWYTWLEQGRGGMPSTDVLDGIATALTLTASEREHLFLLAQHRPPQPHYQAPEGVTPQLQRILDSLEFSPALIRTASWDIVAWNRAAALMLTDYGALAPRQRNLLRLLFCNPCSRERTADWEGHARIAVAAFRSEVARAGAFASVAPLVDELIQLSPEFAALWRDHDVQNYGEGIKHFRHSSAGPITLEYTAFAVDGRPNLNMMIFTAATPTDVERIKAFIGSQS